MLDIETYQALTFVVSARHRHKGVIIMVRIYATLNGETRKTSPMRRDVAVKLLNEIKANGMAPEGTVYEIK